jgi:hypothetical protein
MRSPLCTIRRVYMIFCVQTLAFSVYIVMYECFTHFKIYRYRRTENDERFIRKVTDN